MKSSFFKFLFLILATPRLAHANPEWMVVALSGNETHKLVQNKKSALHIGEKLLTNEEIQTGPQAKVKLVYGGGSILVIAENTLLKLSQPSDEKTQVLELKSGKFRASIQKDNAQFFKYKTPSSVTGIRGTEFFMSAAAEKEIICVLEGEVETTEISSKVKMNLKKNQGWVKTLNAQPIIITTSVDQRKEWILATEL